MRWGFDSQSLPKAELASALGLIIESNNMQFFDVIKNRYSIRSFLNKPVEEEKIKKILETINAAPSAGNLQAYRVILVRNQKTKIELTKAALDQDFISQAPVVLVFLADPNQSAPRYGERGRSLYCLQDTTIACAYAQLVATELGLGSCWVGAFDEEAVKKVLRIKENLKPVAILPIGYSVEKPEVRSRRNLEDLVEER